jgi:hypothetical protein
MSNQDVSALLVKLTYIDVEAQKRAKKKDWLASVEYLHHILDEAKIPNGDHRGAYTLLFRLCGLRAECANAKRERDAVVRALLKLCADGTINQSRAARLLGMKTSEFYEYIKPLVESDKV